jgi:large subunit ribosomal protein L6
MSRIGNKPITLPQGVTATVTENSITVQGPKGSLDFTFHVDMKVLIDGSELTVERPSDSKTHRALHDTTIALIKNKVD